MRQSLGLALHFLAQVLVCVRSTLWYSARKVLVELQLLRLNPAPRRIIGVWMRENVFIQLRHKRFLHGLYIYMVPERIETTLHGVNGVFLSLKRAFDHLLVLI